MVSQLVPTAECQFYTERIVLSSFSNEIRQKVYIPSNRHPPENVPTNYLQTFLVFSLDTDNKVREFRANIALKPDISMSTLRTRTTATFLHLKVSQSTANEFILNSAPMSCYLDPIPSKLFIGCLDSIFLSLTYLFNPYLASDILPQCFKSGLVTPTIKKRCLGHIDLNNYQPVSNSYSIAKILEKLVHSQVTSYLNTHSLYKRFQSAY